MEKAGFDLQGLLRWPREDLHIEIKAWLDLSSSEDKANAAQALIALANHGGGYLIFGLREDSGTFVEDVNRPPSLNGYSQDDLNGVVLRFAEPPFHCTVDMVSHPDTAKVYPIVSVPGGHRVPIRSKRDGPERKHIKQNTYYIRRPGPSSVPVQTGREWDELIGRCVKASKDELIDSLRTALFGFGESEESLSTRHNSWVTESEQRWRELLAERLPDEEPSRFKHGTWAASYIIDSDIQQSESIEDFRQLLRRVEVPESGWPPWVTIDRVELLPYYYQGGLECWLADSIILEPEHSDFWRAFPEGKFYLNRGYFDDSPKNRNPPGTLLDYTLPIYHTCYCLLHASRMANALDVPSATISMRIRWGGLSTRILKSWTENRHLSFDYRSRQDEVIGEIVVPADQIDSNLAESAKKLMTPLYDAFNCPASGIWLFQGIVEKVRKHL